MSETLLEIKNLYTSFFTERGEVKAVRGIELWLKKGKILGIVGESGCGKSVTALSVLRLVPLPGRIIKGEVIFEGQDLSKLSEAEMRRVRGNKIAMVFQEPMTSLNPVFTIGNQIGEAIHYHQGLRRKEVRKKVIESLRLVGIPSPEERVGAYPHQLSGGMRQRAMIAMALSCNPSILIADEPTTALDVTIQAQILDLMMELRDNLGMSMILITHDLGIVAETVHEVLIMYAGQVVEYANVFAIFEDPLHPYTLGLLASVPKLGNKKEKGLETIPGFVPNMYSLPEGCSFQERCFKAGEICKVEPELREVKQGHLVRCWKV